MYDHHVFGVQEKVFKGTGITYSKMMYPEFFSLHYSSFNRIQKQKYRRIDYYIKIKRKYM